MMLYMRAFFIITVTTYNNFAFSTQASEFNLLAKLQLSRIESMLQINYLLPSMNTLSSTKCGITCREELVV